MASNDLTPRLAVPSLVFRARLGNWRSQGNEIAKSLPDVPEPLRAQVVSLYQAAMEKIETMIRVMYGN